MRVSVLSNESALGRLEPSGSAEGDATLVSEALRELEAAPAGERVEMANRAALPQACFGMGKAANPLFAFILDDEGLCREFGDEATARSWLLIDGPACAAHVLARASTIARRVLLFVAVSGHVDQSELFDVLAPRYRVDGALRALLSRDYDEGEGAGLPPMRSIVTDPRFVDLALEVLSSEPRSACGLLGLHGSPRAIDELKGVLERVDVLDESALPPFEGLELALSDDAYLDLLASFLATSPLLTGKTPREIAEGPLGLKLGIHSMHGLRAHRLVREHMRLQDIVAECLRRYPMPVLG